jgi:hypothetical protein
MNTKLTFGELQTGDHFIAFPTPGDNSGHGGYLGTSYIFKKISTKEATRSCDGSPSSTPSSTPVLRVL